MLMEGPPEWMRGRLSTPLEPTCRFTCPSTCSLIIIHVYKLSSLGMGCRTSCIRDEQTEAAAAHRSGHEFIHGEKSPSCPASPLCLPREQTFMKTFPQNHYNGITIPSSLYLRHRCICCAANPPPGQPRRTPHRHRPDLLYILRM